MQHFTQPTARVHQSVYTSQLKWPWDDLSPVERRRGREPWPVHHNTYTHVRRRALRRGMHCSRCGCGSPCARLVARVLRATINKNERAASEAFAYCGRGSESRVSWGSKLQVKSWVRTPRRDMRRWRLAAVGAHRRTRSPFSDERTTFRLQQSTLASEFSFPKQLRSLLSTLPTTQPIEYHVGRRQKARPRAQRKRRGAHRETSLHHRGVRRHGVRKGKVAAAAVRIRPGILTEICCVCPAVDRVQEDHGEAGHRQCGLHAAPGRLH